MKFEFSMQGNNTPGNTEVDGKSPDGKEKEKEKEKEKLPIKRSKGSLGSLNMITGKHNEQSKTGASANGVYPKRYSEYILTHQLLCVYTIGRNSGICSLLIIYNCEFYFLFFFLKLVLFF